MKRKILWIICVALVSNSAIVHQAYADAKYSIKQMTPQVEAALQNRRDRYDKLAELKQKGSIGENNQGYVELLGTDEAAKALVEAENQDRKIIYQTIAAQNDLKDEIATIEKVFAQVQRDKAQSGDRIQDEDGHWITK